MLSSISLEECGKFQLFLDCKLNLKKIKKQENEDSNALIDFFNFMEGFLLIY